VYRDIDFAMLFTPEGRLVAAPPRAEGRYGENRTQIRAHSYMPNPSSDADYALQRVDLTWEDGGAYALLGPSGCGKTTLLNIISGLLEPSEGSILFRRRRRHAPAPTSATSPRCSSSRWCTTR
jgi:ABC-type glutathione transport system ATPase component